jgi:hypothetical protein
MRDATNRGNVGAKPTSTSALAYKGIAMERTIFEPSLDVRYEAIGIDKMEPTGSISSRVPSVPSLKWWNVEISGILPPHEAKQRPWRKKKRETARRDFNIDKKRPIRRWATPL